MTPESNHLLQLIDLQMTTFHVECSLPVADREAQSTHSTNFRKSQVCDNTIKYIIIHHHCHFDHYYRHLYNHTMKRKCAEKSGLFLTLYSQSQTPAAGTRQLYFVTAKRPKLIQRVRQRGGSWWRSWYDVTHFSLLPLTANYRCVKLTTSEDEISRGG